MSDLTVAAAAAELVCSPKTVYKLLRKGTLRGYKVGRDWRIRPNAIECAKTPIDPPPVTPESRLRVSPRRSSPLPGWNKFTSR